MSDEIGPYTGPVCYVDGWHFSVEKDPNGYDVPGQKLYLEEDGTYRLAQDADASWFDRKHQNFIDLFPRSAG